MFPKLQVSLKSLLSDFQTLWIAMFVAAIFWPLAIITYLINFVARKIVTVLYGQFYAGRYVLANGADSVFGTKIPGNSASVISAFKVFKGKPNLKMMQNKISAMLQRKSNGFKSPYEKLKHTYSSKLGYFCWDVFTAATFDIRNHVKLMDGWDPKEIGDENTILNYLESKSTCHFDGDLPQWEMLFIPKFRRGDESEITHYALAIRLHHAYCDGVSYILMMNKELADVPGKLIFDVKQPFPTPFWVKAIVYLKVILIGPFNFFRHMVALMKTPSVFKVANYNDTKYLVRSREIVMEDLKLIRKTYKASITSIILSVMYSALYRSHKVSSRGARKYIPDIMYTAVVGAMLPYKDEEHTSPLVNQFTMWPFIAPLEYDGGPVSRLTNMMRIHRHSSTASDPIFDFYIACTLGSMPEFCHWILYNLSAPPIMVSNVPGLISPVWMFESEMVDCAAWIPLVHSAGIGIATQSYCGKLRMCLIVDTQIFNDRRHVENLGEYIIQEMEFLAQSCRQPPSIVETCVSETQKNDVNNAQDANNNIDKAKGNSIVKFRVKQIECVTNDTQA